MNFRGYFVRLGRAAGSKWMGPVVGAAVICLTVSMAPQAYAAGRFSLSGAAQVVVGGTGSNNAAVDLTSNCGTCFNNTGAFVYSTVDYAPTGGLTVADIKQLSTDYNVGATNCTGGSPRFVIELSNGDNLVYNFGVNKFGTCYAGWQNTGNAADSNNTDPRWQINLSNTFSTWADVVAAEGSQTVTSVSIVQDSGWIAPQGEDTTVDNFTINKASMNGSNVH